MVIQLSVWQECQVSMKSALKTSTPKGTTGETKHDYLRHI